jgi:hypothetical protein
MFVPRFNAQRVIGSVDIQHCVYLGNSERFQRLSSKGYGVPISNSLAVHITIVHAKSYPPILCLAKRTSAVKGDNDRHIKPVDTLSSSHCLRTKSSAIYIG